MIYRVDGLPESPDLTEVQDLEAISIALRRSNDDGSPVFALDTETTSLHIRECGLVGISLSTSDGTTFYIGTGHQCPAAHNSPLEVIKELLDPFFFNVDQTIVYHNAPFDLAVLRDHGFRARHKIFDTMLASHLCDSTRRRVGKTNKLKELSVEFLDDVDQPSFAETTGGGNFELVPVREAAVYAGFDAYCTFQLYGEFKKTLKKHGALAYFTDIEMANHWNTADMVFNGVKVNMVELAKARRDADEALEKLERLIQRDPHVRRVFDISSPEQLRNTLFGGGLREGRLFKDSLSDVQCESTSSEDLVRLLRERKDAAALVKNILKYRKVDGILSKYLYSFPARENPKTGRIHPSVRATTISGRYHCSEPNILGLPKKTTITADGKSYDLSVRNLIVPEPGWKIVTADFSQIDMRCIGHYSEDPRLLDALKNDWDLHLAALAILERDLMQSLCGVEPDKVAKRKEEQRNGRKHCFIILKKQNGEEKGAEIPIDPDKFAELNKCRSEMKAVNFGISYGMGAEGLRRKLNDFEDIEDLDKIDDRRVRSLEECEIIISKFFDRYARIPVYKSEARRMACSKGGMSNIFGRPLHLAVFNRLINGRCLLDCSTKKGEVRLDVEPRGLFQEGLECLLHCAWEIDPVRHVDEGGDKAPSQREIESWRNEHNDLTVGHRFFRLLEDDYQALRRQCHIDSDSSPKALCQFERRLPATFKQSLSERDHVLRKHGFDTTLTALYRQRNLTPFESLPFVFVPHQIVRLIKLDKPVGFIPYGKLTEAFRQLSSYLISSTSMDISKTAMIRMRDFIEHEWPDENRRPRILFCVHDELVYEVPDDGDSVARFEKQLLATMRKKPCDGFLAPVDAEAKSGHTYETAK